MEHTTAPHAPPCCPNPACPYHSGDRQHWRFHRDGVHSRRCPPRVVQRYRCLHCRRSFSAQTFRTSYWLRRPDLLRPLFLRLVACSAFRQIAREFDVAPSTVARLAARLGRHCLLFHEQHRPHGPLTEPLVLDSFISFEYSQYYPTAFHLLAGQDSHFFYGFTDSELRRSGTMTVSQRQRRQDLEARLGRPDPRAVEHEVATLLRIVAPLQQPLTLHSDQHTDYPRALRRVTHLSVTHHRTSSRAARTPHNPLFAVNLLDLLIRHSGANHKRETIAFSKRRQSAAERMAVLMVWRNYLKWVSEHRHDDTPAMRVGVAPRRWTVGEVLAARLFPTRVRLPERWARYYERRIVTRAIPGGTVHHRVFAS